MLLLEAFDMSNDIGHMIGSLDNKVIGRNG
jgi:hypothetical protein